MKRRYKLLILLVLSLSVYFIYLYTQNSVYTIMNIGDGLSLGLNSYEIKEYSYIDYLKEEKLTENDKVKVINYAKKSQSLNEVLQLLKYNSTIKRELSNTNILIVTLGYNDLIYELNIEENLDNEKLEKIMQGIKQKYNSLLTEIRKYYKKEIIVVGYYSPNKYNSYLDQAIKKLNSIIKGNSEVNYIDTYNLLSNKKLYFSNPNSYYPNRQAYHAIYYKIDKKVK